MKIQIFLSYPHILQGWYGHGKAWKVMELYNSIFQAWNLSAGHGKSLKVMFLVQNH